MTQIQSFQTLRGCVDAEAEAGTTICRDVIHSWRELPNAETNVFFVVMIDHVDRPSERPVYGLGVKTTTPETAQKAVSGLFEQF